MLKKHNTEVTKWRNAENKADGIVMDTGEKMTTKERELYELKAQRSRTAFELQVADEVLDSSTKEISVLEKQLRIKKDRRYALGVQYKRALVYEHERQGDHSSTEQEVTTNIDQLKNKIDQLEERDEFLETKKANIQEELDVAENDWFKKILGGAKRIPEDIWSYGEEIVDKVTGYLKELVHSNKKKEYISVSPHLESPDATRFADGQYAEGEELATEDSAFIDSLLSETIVKFSDWARIQKFSVHGPLDSNAAVDAEIVDERGVATTTFDMRHIVNETRNRLVGMEAVLTKDIERIRSIRDESAFRTKDRENVRDILDYYRRAIDNVLSLKRQIESLEGRVRRTDEMLFGWVELQDGSGHYFYELRRLTQEVAGVRQRFAVAAGIQNVGTYWADTLWRIKAYGLQLREIATVNSELDGVNSEATKRRRDLEGLEETSEGRLGVVRERYAQARKLVGEIRVAWFKAKREVNRLVTAELEMQEKLQGMQRMREEVFTKLTSEGAEVEKLETALKEFQKTLEKANDQKLAAQESKVSVETLQSEHESAVGYYRAQESHYKNKNAKYVHVMDGGAADNVGFTPLVELLNSFFSAEMQSVNDVNRWKRETEYVAAILVDARASRTDGFSQSRTAPGVYDSLMATIDTAIDGTSFLLTRELERVTEELELKKAIKKRFLIRVDFDSIEKFSDDVSLSSCRTAYRKIPTNWNLSAEVVDGLMRMGRALVLNSADFGEMIDLLRLQEPSNVESVEAVCEIYENVLEKEFGIKPRKPVVEIDEKR